MRVSNAESARLEIPAAAFITAARDQIKSSTSAGITLNIRVVSLVCAGALSLIASETALDLWRCRADHCGGDGRRRPRPRLGRQPPSLCLLPNKTPPSGPQGQSNVRKRPTLRVCRARREDTSCASASAAHERRAQGDRPCLRRRPTNGLKRSSPRETGCAMRSVAFFLAGLAFGHGATTALDEAAFLILEGLRPADRHARSVSRRADCFVTSA